MPTKTCLPFFAANCARPKSHNLGQRFASIKTLLGFKSRSIGKASNKAWKRYGTNSSRHVRWGWTASQATITTSSTHGVFAVSNRASNACPEPHHWPTLVFATVTSCWPRHREISAKQVYRPNERNNVGGGRAVHQHKVVCSMPAKHIVGN